MSRLAVLAMALVACGCGYRLAGPAGLYPDNIETVAIGTVSNETFERADTARLTSALIRELETRTPYRTAPLARADSVLEVTITRIARRTTSRNPGSAIPDEQLYVVLADVLWKDVRTGKVLLRLENFEQTAALYPTLGESGFISSQEAAEELAAGIVEAMGGAW